MDDYKLMEVEWKRTCNRFVLFIDIMGFKDMVMRWQSDKIHSLMLKAREIYAANFASVQQKDGSHATTGTHIRAGMYSDSIVLYSVDDSDNSLRLMTLSASYIYGAFLTETIPHKGALAQGEFTADEKNSIFFGQPLIDAIQLQEQLKIYAIAIHGSAEESIKKAGLNPIDLFHYACPLKTNRLNHLLVSPLIFYFKDLVLEGRESVMENFRYITTGENRIYLEETDAFINAIKALYEKERFAGSR